MCIFTSSGRNYEWSVFLANFIGWIKTFFIAVREKPVLSSCLMMLDDRFASDFFYLKAHALCYIILKVQVPLDNILRKKMKLELNTRKAVSKILSNEHCHFWMNKDLVLSFGRIKVWSISYIDCKNCKDQMHIMRASLNRNWSPN